MIILFCFKIVQDITKMFSKISWYYVTCLCFALSDGFSVETLPKCSIKDSTCQKNLYQKVIKEVGEPGIPALKIPPLDPIVLKNVAVGVMDIANLTLVDGVAKGIKDCVLNKFEIDVEKGIGKQEVLCDFVIKGHYTLSGDSELLKGILGNGGLRGDGKGKVKLEKLLLKMRFNFYPVKHDDGEIYFRCLYKEMEYDYDIKGKASFAADNIFVGKENISDFVIKYLNDNWKYVLKTFGKAFVDKAMEYYFEFAEKFFEGIPAKHYITDDLSPYVKE